MKMKKIMGLALAAMLYAATASAAQVNTIIDTGSGMFAEPEKVYTEIDNTVMSWFFPKYSEKEIKKMSYEQKQKMQQSLDMTLVPTGDSDAIVQIYREEKGTAVSSDEVVSGTNSRDITITKEDLSNLSKDLDADYIFYFRVTNTVPTSSTGFLSAGQKTNVTTDFRIWDNKAQNYTFVKRYQTTGSSSSFYLGNGSAANAVKDGLSKALKLISKDREKIVATVNK